MKTKPNIKLLTFYKFVDIENPLPIVEDHKQFCNDIGMKGRIFIGEEGINAAVTGNSGQIKAYRLYLESISYFKEIPDIDIKATSVEDHQFPKMIVRYRKEIVALGVVYKADLISNASHKMTIDDFKKVVDIEDDSYVILDMRNNYEYKLGHFKNAIPAGTANFRELDKVVNKYKGEFGDKKIIMYCTGGIRCEKASVLLERAGLPGVYQLDGGVVKYVNTFNDGNWLGNLYTFDSRISTKVGDETTHTIIGRSHYSGEPAEVYFNCRYAPCNDQIIATEEEYQHHFGFCSEECYQKSCQDLLVRNENFDKFDYKKIRTEIKIHPEKFDNYKVWVQNHLDKKLSKVEFKIKQSMKGSQNI
jgi:UPF0176 protein